MGLKMKDKGTKKKKRRKKHYLLKLVLLVALGTGIYYFVTSSFFDIQKLTVKENMHYTSQQIIGIAEAKTGENLFRTPVDEMKDRLLADPYIRNVRISKKLPGELIIMVEEREEAACVPYGEEYLIIDKAGMILRQTDKEPTLTMLSGMTLANIKVGTALEAEQKSMLTKTLQLLNTMEEHELFFKRIDFSGILIRAYIYDTLYCEGSPENILKSMDDLEDVLYDLYIQGIERGVIRVGGNGYYSFSASFE